LTIGGRIPKNTTLWIRCPGPITEACSIPLAAIGVDRRWARPCWCWLSVWWVGGRWGERRGRRTESNGWDLTCREDLNIPKFFWIRSISTKWDACDIGGGGVWSLARIASEIIPLENTSGSDAIAF